MNRHYFKKHLQHKQDLAYVKHIKCSNKLKSDSIKNQNNLNQDSTIQGFQSKNYQNLKNNEDYQNLENIRTSNKKFSEYQNQQNPCQQHLKHIENVYIQQNMMTNSSISNHLGIFYHL